MIAIIDQWSPEQWTSQHFFAQSAGQAGQQNRRREHGSPHCKAVEPEKED
jgi:hypothetical protein